MLISRKPRSSVYAFAATLFFFCVVAAGGTAFAAELKPHTAAAFDRYVDATQKRFPDELKPGGAFLYTDALPAGERNEKYGRLRNGEILVDKRDTKAPGADKDVPDGMVHHWVALVFVPRVTLAQVLPVVKDYDHRAELYKPEIIASRLVSHQGDDYKIFLRIYQKKFTTVVFNSDYDVHWGEVSSTQLYSNTISTRIAQVKAPDQPDGPEYPPWQRQRLSLAIKHLLALPGERRRRLHTMRSIVAYARYSHRTGLAAQAAGNENSAGLAQPCAGANETGG